MFFKLYMIAIHNIFVINLFTAPYAIDMQHTKLRGSNITKKVGGWRPLGSQFKAAKNKRSLRSKSEDVKMTENKSDDPVDETLEKRTGSKKLLVLTGKQKNIKPKLPNKKRKLRALWFNLVAAFDQ